jgi:hypothetical protein
MSQPKHDRPADSHSTASGDTRCDTAKLGSRAPDPEHPDAATGLRYVFKIAPADPKNSLDFEDVADK